MKPPARATFERTELNKEKTGVKIEGVTAIDPVNGAEVPIFISDYVLATYGTGAIMAVPAHDSRDWEFAKKFGLPISRSSRAIPRPTWMRLPLPMLPPARWSTPAS